MKYYIILAALLSALTALPDTGQAQTSSSTQPASTSPASSLRPESKSPESSGPESSSPAPVKPKPKPPSAATVKARTLWKSAKTSPARQAVLKSQSAKLTAYLRGGNWREDKWLAVGIVHAALLAEEIGEPIPGYEFARTWLKGNANRYYYDHASTPDELLQWPRSFGTRWQSARRNPHIAVTTFGPRLAAQHYATGETHGDYVRLVTDHIATLSDKDAIAFLTREIAALAKKGPGKGRDSAASHFLGTLAIRKELAALK